KVLQPLPLWPSAGDPVYIFVSPKRLSSGFRIRGFGVVNIAHTVDRARWKLAVWQPCEGSDMFENFIRLQPHIHRAAHGIGYVIGFVIMWAAQARHTLQRPGLNFFIFARTEQNAVLGVDAFFDAALARYGANAAFAKRGRQ